MRPVTPGEETLRRPPLSSSGAAVHLSPSSKREGQGPCFEDDAREQARFDQGEVKYRRQSSRGSPSRRQRPKALAHGCPLQSGTPHEDGAVDAPETLRPSALVGRGSFGEEERRPVGIATDVDQGAIHQAHARRWQCANRSRCSSDGGVEDGEKSTPVASFARRFLFMDPPAAYGRHAPSTLLQAQATDAAAPAVA